MFVTSQDDVRCHEPTTISQKEQSGDRRGTGKKDSTAPHNVRQLLKTTIVSLSAMAIMLGTRGQNMSITGKVLLLYSTTVLLFLVAVFGWNLGINSGMDPVTNIQVHTWSLGTIGHFAIFYINLIRPNGIYSFFDMWQVYRHKYACEPGSLKFKSNVSAAMIWIVLVLSICLTITGYDGLLRIIGANTPVYILMNLLAYIYHSATRVSSSILMLLITNVLSDEYQQICKQISDLSEGDIYQRTLHIGYTRRRHWELSQIVRKADGIFCAHMGLSVVTSLVLSCLNLYQIIWGRALDGNSSLVVTYIFWFVTSLTKLTTDCVAGIILNDAVGDRHFCTQ